MKKISLFLKDAVKAIIGIPIWIGCYEILNLIVSNSIGAYVRLDAGILQNVIESYISGGMLGYLLAFLMFSFTRIGTDKKMDDIQRVKSMILQVWIMSIIVAIINGIILFDKTVFSITMAFSIIFGLITLVIYLLEDKRKNGRKEINKELEQEQLEFENKFHKTLLGKITKIILILTILTMIVGLVSMFLFRMFNLGEAVMNFAERCIKYSGISSFSCMLIYCIYVPKIMSKDK